MLSETEIHYLVGFLYLHTKRTDITLGVSGVLGEKVYDSAAEKDRDVDIVVATAGSTAMIGVEVKDEGRPLDVTKVEQIAAKLNDMPDLTERFVVSSSGFSKPAIKKAHTYGLRCLRLARGALPVVATIDMTALTSFVVTTTKCLDNPKPNVHLLHRADIPSALREQLTHASPVLLADRTTIDAGELTNRLVTAAVNGLGSQYGSGDHPFNTEITVGDPPTIQLPGGDLSITHARVSGVLRRSRRDVPADEQCYLEDDEGRPFALAVLAEVDGALFGLMLNETRHLGAFLLPEALRSVRPVRHSLGAQPQPEVELQRVDR